MDYEVDERIRKLVEAVNAAGAITTSSCGGHRCPTAGQVPKDEFVVDFYVPQCSEGWIALDILSRVVMEAPYCELQVWHDCGLRFELRGYGGQDPDELAQAISRYKV